MCGGGQAKAVITPVLTPPTGPHTALSSACTGPPQAARCACAHSLAPAAAAAALGAGLAGAGPGSSMLEALSVDMPLRLSSFENRDSKVPSGPTEPARVWPAGSTHTGRLGHKEPYPALASSGQVFRCNPLHNAELPPCWLSGCAPRTRLGW